jgi:hypothetical protein
VRLPSFIYDHFLDTAGEIATRFHEHTRDMPPVPSGLMFSDAMCVCAMCELSAVDCLVEAGTGFGSSTEMFARYFLSAGSVRRIISIDLHQGWISSQLSRLRGESSPHIWRWNRGRLARDRARLALARFPNVELRYGDARILLPSIVSELAAQGTRIGVVIDGPKEEAQLALAHELLALSPLVRFAAMDDIGPIYHAGARYQRFLTSPYPKFSTTEHGFFKRFAWLEGDRLSKQDPTFEGHGLGVLVNQPAS